MATISLCMIVKNEEDTLGRCLDCMKGIADEIVIVDTGSTDRTKEIARQYTEKVIDFEWIDDFSAARNVSFSHAKMDYCMWLDADDVILEKDREALLLLKTILPPETDVVMMRYNTSFYQDGTPAYSYYRERLLRSHSGFVWGGAVHEAITPRGSIVYSDIAVTHRKTRPSEPGRNLRIFEKLLAKGETLEPRGQFYYARELYYHKRYEDACREFEAFLDSGLGWVENEIDACRHLSYCCDALGNGSGALHALLRTLEYDLPRAEVCCELGDLFLKQGLPERAVFWYETALTRERPDRSGAFVAPDRYGYYPSIQLCVCYDRLGQYERAQEYNERAGREKPNDPAYLQNQKYFAERQAYANSNNKQCQNNR